MNRALAGALVAALTAFGAGGCGSSAPTDGNGSVMRPPDPPAGPADRAPVDAHGRTEFTHRIEDERAWSRVAARPRNQTVARTEVVKFLIDLADDRRLWFIDTQRWDVHFHFAHQRLSTPERPIGSSAEDHRRFNIEQYRREDRRFVMGSVVHYLDPDVWAFEMIAGDTLEGRRVLRAFQQIQAATYFGERLRYRPVSELHETRIAPVRDRLPTVGAAEVFRGVRYQPLTQGVAFGTLRFVRGPLDASTVRPDQILVLEQLPDEIPVVSGVISQELQAPLGHLALLCATRGTPNTGLRDALSDERLTALEGRLVRLQVGAQELSVRAAEPAEAEASWAQRRPPAPLTPRLEARDRGLPDVCALTATDASTVGAKAAQLGEACQLGAPIVTPGGFAISFHHYLAHLRRSGAAPGIAGMLADGDFRANATARAERLAQLRAIVQRTGVDPALLRRVRARIASFSGSPRVILRSSTNAEDLPGFTGAGLYRSVVIGANATDAELADAMREVWSSVWLAGAYEEREWYRIDHRQVAMAVLVQPFVDGAVINGVAITANPFYQARPAYFVNAQALGGSVTGAGGDEVPEQHLIYTYSEDLEIELVSRSSVNDGAPLMRDREIRALAEVLRRLHEHFVPQWTGRANAVDVEFLIAGPDRHVVLLQARPFNVVYQEGQRWED